MRKKSGEIRIVEFSAEIIEVNGHPCLLSQVMDITERKQTEAKLKESQKKYKALIETTSDFIWEMDSQGRYTYCSPQMEKLWGLKPEKMVGKTPFDIMPAGQKEKTAEDFLKVMESPSPFTSLETTAYDSQGRLVFLETSGVPFFDNNGKLLGFRGITRDLTERKQMETDLEMLASFPRINPNPIIEVDLEVYVHYTNPAANKLFPTLTESASNHPLLTDLFQAIQTMLNGGTNTYVRDLQIGDRWYQQSMHLVPNAQRIRIYCLEITERKLAEIALQEAHEELEATEEELRQQNDELRAIQSALQENEEKYRTIVETASEGIIIARPEGNYIYANQQMADLLGYRANEILGKSNLDFAVDETRIQVIQAQEELRKGDKVNGEFKFRRKDGSSVWTMYNATPIFNGKGEHIANISMFTDITERRQAEEAVRSSHQILNGIINAIPVRVFWKDRNLVYLGCNEIFAKDAGFADPRDIIGKDDYQMGWRDQAELYRADDLQVIESGLPKLLTEEPQTTPDGSTITLLTSKIPLHSSDGEIIGVLGTYMDITERKEMENALLDSENMYKTIFENTGTSTIIIEDNTTISLANSEFERFTGYSKKEIEGKKSWTEFIVKDDLERMLEQHKLRRTTPSSALNNYEFQAIDRNGNIKDVLLRVGTISGTKKSIASMLDITERKKAEEKLHSSQTMLEMVMNNIPQGIFWKDRCSVYLGCNKVFAKNAGLESTAEIIGKADYDMPWSLEQKELFREYDSRIMENDAPEYHTVEQMREADGKLLWVETNKVPLHDAQGKVIGILGTYEDITERKRAEEELKWNEALLEAQVEASLDGILVVDEKGQRVITNQRLLNMWSVPEEIRNTKDDAPLLDYVVGKTRDPDQFLEKVLYLYDHHYEISRDTIEFKEGMVFDRYSSPVLGRDSHYYGRTWTFRDITDRKQAEERIIASLHEKEVLLKEVHHRVKNNLGIISALLSLQSSYLNDEDLIKIFRDSQNRIKSMALIHENLYKSKDLDEIDFNEYANQLVSHLSQSYGDPMGKIKFKVNSENVYLNINTAIPCGMIINELVSNSLKYAFPDGRRGEICIDLSSKDDGFKLVVSDNGVGIKGDLNIKDSKTLGFRLIDTLIKQIHGEMKLNTINGIRCEIRFKGLK